MAPGRASARRTSRDKFVKSVTANAVTKSDPRSRHPCIHPSSSCTGLDTQSHAKGLIFPNLIFLNEAQFAERHPLLPQQRSSVGGRYGQATPASAASAARAPVMLPVHRATLVHGLSLLLLLPDVAAAPGVRARPRRTPNTQREPDRRHFEEFSCRRHLAGSLWAGRPCPLD